MPNPPVHVYECMTRFTTINPLPAEVEQELRDVGVVDTGLELVDGEYRFTTRVEAEDPGQAVVVAYRVLRDVVERADIPSGELAVFESSAIKR